MTDLVGSFVAITFTNYADIEISFFRKPITIMTEISIINKIQGIEYLDYFYVNFHISKDLISGLSRSFFL